LGGAAQPIAIHCRKGFEGFVVTVKAVEHCSAQVELPAFNNDVASAFKRSKRCFDVPIPLQKQRLEEGNALSIDLVGACALDQLIKFILSIGSLV